MNYCDTSFNVYHNYDEKTKSCHQCGLISNTVERIKKYTTVVYPHISIKNKNANNENLKLVGLKIEARDRKTPSICAPATISKKLFQII